MDRGEQARKENEQGENAALWVPGPMPGLNELLDARARSYRRDGKLWNAYSDLKRSWEERIVLLARSQGFPLIESGGFCYFFDEPNQRRDPSNVASGAAKFIEDALVKAGLLKNDGWGAIRRLEFRFTVKKAEPGVYLRVRNPIFWQKDAEDERKKRIERAKRDIERKQARARAHAGLGSGAERDA